MRLLDLWLTFSDGLRPNEVSLLVVVLDVGLRPEPLEEVWGEQLTATNHAYLLIIRQPPPA